MAGTSPAMTRVGDKKRSRFFDRDEYPVRVKLSSAHPKPRDPHDSHASSPSPASPSGSISLLFTAASGGSPNATRFRAARRAGAQGHKRDRHHSGARRGGGDRRMSFVAAGPRIFRAADIVLVDDQSTDGPPRRRKPAPPRETAPTA